MASPSSVLPPACRDTLAMTPRQRELVANSLARIDAAEHWHGGLPVLLLERCWLRMSVVAVSELALRLPPDCTRDAPELVRYRQLLASGHDAFEAEQICWLDFGMEACRQAQHRFWRGQELGNHGWTLDRYLALLHHYRQRLQQGHGQPLPLLVLARAGEPAASSSHRLIWLGRQDG